MGKHTWRGSMSVEAGDHLDVIGVANTKYFWHVKNSYTKEEGYVIQNILITCKQHPESNCVVASETYDASSYLKFKKGDRLMLDQTTLDDYGWIMAKHMGSKYTVKRSTFAKDSPNQGYIHAGWVVSQTAHIGFIVARFCGLGLNISDTTTDLLNGLDLLQSQKTPSGVVLYVCDELHLYSHPIWGSVALGLVWLPGAPLFLYEVAEIWKLHGWQQNKFKCCKGVLFESAKFIAWPLTSLLL